MESPSSSTYDASRFLDDVRRVAELIGSPYSEDATRTVVEDYKSSFKAVLWHVPERHGYAINYHFYKRSPTDPISPAAEAGILDADNSLISLLKSWSMLYEGMVEQPCDFNAATGLSKLWVFLRGRRPIDDALDAPHVPVQRHREIFHELSLSLHGTSPWTTTTAS